AFVAGVGCARGVTLSHWSAQAAGASSGKSAAAVSAESSVPICRGQADEYLDPIAGRGVRDRGRDAAPSIRRIERGGINRGVGQRNLGQVLARTHGRGVREERFRRGLRRADNHDRGRERSYEDGSVESQVTLGG